MSKFCHCGQPLHYSDKNIEAQINELCEKLGDFMKVTDVQSGKTFMVQRHYIALHGIKGKDVASLGFQEAIEVKK